MAIQCLVTYGQKKRLKSFDFASVILIGSEPCACQCIRVSLNVCHSVIDLDAADGFHNVSQ